MGLRLQRQRLRFRQMPTPAIGNLFAVGQTVGQPTRTVADMTDPGHTPDDAFARIPKQGFCPDTEAVNPCTQQAASGVGTPALTRDSDGCRGRVKVSNELSYNYGAESATATGRSSRASALRV
jgi:hypothetical protein